MRDVPTEPFHLALAHLRRRLRSGDLVPGARLSPVDLADALRLSTTPLREALSRLAGEGLIEDRRGLGYFVRLPGAADIADLYRMSLAYLLIALEPRRAARPGPMFAELSAGPEPDSAIERVDGLFRAWVRETGSPTLIRRLSVLQIQLGPVRRFEPLLIDDLDGEAARLAAAAGARAERLAQARLFHGLRIREAPRFADLLEASARPL